MRQNVVYTITLAKASCKYLESLPFKKAEHIIDVLEDLRRDPFANSVSLHGPLKGLRRAKVGNLRIIFELDISEKKILVKAIGPRGDIYKRA